MINPSSIDLKSLPWLPLDLKRELPEKPCIYFAIDSLGNIQYIGRTVNVKKRWLQHDKFASLKAITGIRIAYLSVDEVKLLPEIEKALIEYFNPTLNARCKQKRDEVAVHYRIVSSVKKGIVKTSDAANRSENLQAEYLIKLGLLAIAGIDPTKLTAGQITDKFDELYGDSETTLNQKTND